MITATLHELRNSSKMPELDSDCNAKPTNDGTLIIRLTLRGIDSVEIISDQSETELELMDLWASLRAALVSPR